VSPTGWLDDFPIVKHPTTVIYGPVIDEASRRAHLTETHSLPSVWTLSPAVLGPVARPHRKRRYPHK
jgi:hypothetical protein